MISLNYPALYKTQAYINGQWIQKENSFDLANPLNGNIIDQITDCDATELNIAVDAAAEAFKTWSKLSASKRSRVLKKWHQLQLTHAKDLATILTTEQGKVYKEALGEVKYGASFVEWFAEEAKRVYGDIIPSPSSRQRITVIKQAIGVVGAITPWNFPSAMITRKLSPALAAGCTVVLKPSEFTPLSALALAQLAEEAGFPPGVINILPSNDARSIGTAMTSHPLVKKISFTGSTRVGKILLKNAADQIKKITLELGGNAPFIVFADADIEAAVDGCMQSKFRNAGQTCICTNRIFVHADVKENFVALLSKKIQKLKLGDGMNDQTDIGPMINAAAVSKNESLLADAQSKGAKIHAGGAKEQDYFFQPTLLSNLNNTMSIYNEEIFGPIAAVYTFENESEAIRLANDTHYGLAAYFYGKDVGQIWRVAEALEYGMVGINTTGIGSAVSPFGGIKQSGIGREGSKYGIHEYLNIKSMVWGGL